MLIQPIVFYLLMLVRRNLKNNHVHGSVYGGVKVCRKGSISGVMVYNLYQKQPALKESLVLLQHTYVATRWK